MEEVLIDTRNYLQGTCYGCAFYFHCNIDNTYSSCGCTNKTEKPKKAEKTNFYSRRFDPTKTYDSQQLFLKSKDEIYGYNLDFSQKFSLLFCTKYNSTYDRLKSNKLPKNTLPSLSNPKNSENIVIEEFKFKLIVKKRNGSLLLAKWLTIQVKEFENFLSSLEVSQLNSNGPGTHLEDENDFKEFINEYSDITSHKKSMEYEESDSESVSTEVVNDSKKVKNKTPKISDLDDDHLKKAEIISELRSKYHCILHQLPCITNSGMHKKLTCVHLELWSTEIIKGFATINEPPTYPIFGFNQKSVACQYHQINSNESQIFYPPSPYQTNHLFTPNMYQNYAPNIYQNYTSTPLITTTNTDVNIINSNKNVNIQKFFENLDKKFGDEVFSVYLENFLDQCIEIQHIPELEDEEFTSLGITKIGHKKTLLMEVKKYS
ncbi:hypothetical protein RclHR1_09850002 [Rhizophagus clarus]|uniref:SAM domain-containing protein n=1 Tax=Rhizophagus clarus TaxID=94130 RepID=A0A2Z6SBJ1_9GLOM|nr:hypothetical protein RclHR1_09850002 [Rhizophagus clarus]GES80746.1 hypothetical protein GLOIN_2v1486073 [Rhizophagus clarus]